MNVLALHKINFLFVYQTHISRSALFLCLIRENYIIWQETVYLSVLRHSIRLCDSVTALSRSRLHRHSVARRVGALVISVIDYYNNLAVSN